VLAAPTQLRLPPLLRAPNQIVFQVQKLRRPAAPHLASPARVIFGPCSHPSRVRALFFFLGTLDSALWTLSFAARALLSPGRTHSFSLCAPEFFVWITEVRVWTLEVRARALFWARCIPFGEGTFPLGDSTVARGDATVPFEGATGPKEGRYCPLEGATIPFGDGTVPFEGATEKSGDASRPKEGASAHFEGRCDPQEGQYDPREGSSKNRLGRNLDSGSRSRSIRDSTTPSTAPLPHGRAPRNGGFPALSRNAVYPLISFFPSRESNCGKLRLA
jgi:hypothetical protein